MAASKCKPTLKKKLNSELSGTLINLRKENSYLKKTLAELSRHHAEHNKLVERFLSLETIRLEGSHQPAARDEKATLSNEAVCPKEGNSSKGALDKNKQWLEYDQQREAYVRAVVARISELEKQLREADQARSQQHNDNHSDEEQLSQMQEHYESLLQKAKEEQEELRKQLEDTCQSLKMTESWCTEREKEVEQLRQLLQSSNMSRESAQGEPHYSEEEEQPPEDENKDLEVRLNEEKRRSANFELQASIFQRYMLNRHHADQETIAELTRQMKISSQDLEDEKQNCSYLKKQMVRVLKMLPKTKGHASKHSKRNQQDQYSHDEEQASCSSPAASSARSSGLNESLLECPSCQAEYPTSHYRELLHHLESCQD
ncbi:centrosomal protein of 55 kDa-like isoform 3-T4 [Menidia menidia]